MMIRPSEGTYDNGGKVGRSRRERRYSGMTKGRQLPHRLGRTERSRHECRYMGILGRSVSKPRSGGAMTLSRQERPHSRSFGALLSAWGFALCVMLGFGCGVERAAWAWNPQVVDGTCRQSGSRCDGTIGNRGQSSGACCDPANSNIVTCASQNPCIGGRPYKWATSRLPLSWYFNPNNMPGQSGYVGLSATQIETAVKRGWDAWSTATCTSFSHNYRGQTTTVPSRRADSQVVLYLASPSTWAQLGGGGSTLAFTIPIPDRNTGELQDADIVYNPNPGNGWGIGNKTDIVGVTAHEVGHAIGFAHAPLQTSLMFYAHTGNFSTLPQDDRDAVCFTYPGSCTTDAQCGACLQCVSQRCTRKTITQVQNLCKPCTGPNDCGGTKDICIRLEEGQRCAQDCSNGGCCPVGYRCSEVGLGQQMCIPDSGQCPPVPCTTDAQCGPGEQCVGAKCQPKPVPPDAKLCKACTQNSDCGGSNSCFDFPDGKSRCAQPCAFDNFCPTNYRCLGTSSGRFCFPEEFICPCTGNSDCGKDEICSNGACRLAVCKYGCSCSDKAVCDAPYECFQTPNGGLCFQACGGTSTGNFPPGSPGGACNNGQCTLGAQCFQLQGGGNICLKPCTSNTNCTSTGGRCYTIGGQNFCACQNNSECLNGQACNTSVLGNGGACATSSGSQACEAGYSCNDVGGVKICEPIPTQEAGQPCGLTKVCKAGLFCLQTTASSDSAVCFEDCTTTNQCKTGGSCILTLSNNNKACACTADSQCLNGKKCLRVLNGGQSGYCGQPSFNCGNGQCELNTGENCINCLKDCPCAAGLVCNSTGGCSQAGPRCGDGKCDTGENCGSCATDCKCTAGQVCNNGTCGAPPQSCGNKTCDTAQGENCSTCAGDCPCATGQTCNNGVCGTAPAECGNGTCQADKGENCGTCAVDCSCPTGQVCNGGTCTTPPQSCGNGTCDTAQGENCGTCPGDCPCGTGTTCVQNQCVSTSAICGNNTCETPQGENCSTCSSDCRCGTGTTCQNGRCVAGSPDSGNGPNCPIEDQVQQCEEDGTNCKSVCAGDLPPKTCGCSSASGTSVPSILLMCFALLFMFRRRRA